MTVARSTFGPAYDASADGARLASQRERIRHYMLLHDWQTLAEISAALQEPEASVSAQLRHLRKPKFGEWSVEKRHAGKGLWEYRVRPFVPQHAQQEEADWPAEPRHTEGDEW